MREDVERDMSKSGRAFLYIVWPKVRALCGGGELVSVETDTSSRLSKELDTKAGIDAWQIHQDKGIRGIASRVQFIQTGKRAYASFTVRESRSSGARTELSKRMECLDKTGEGWLFPGLTVQGYVEGQELMYAAVANTRDLYRYIANGEEGIHWERQINPADRNTFIVVWVEGLTASGINVHEVVDNPIRLTRRWLPVAEAV